MPVDDHLVTEALEVLLDRADRGEHADRAVLAAGLAVAEPEVVEVVANLRARAVVAESDGTLTLTSDGRELAVRAVRRHRLAERLLLDVVGLEWWKVHHESEGFERVISDEVEARLVELLGDPGTCPHGNPIPGSANRPDQTGAVTLEDAPAGPVHVVRITEALEADDEALRLLQSCGFVPGRDAELKAVDDDGAEVAGTVSDAHLPPHVARQTYVVPR